MILVSGARGPGFNSRIAPYFCAKLIPTPLPLLFIIIKGMKLGFETTEETEEIIKLRVELARNKSKIVKYEQITAQLTQLGESSSKIIENLSNNNMFLCDLGKQLNLNFTAYQVSKGTVGMEGKDTLAELFSKNNQMLKITEKEADILRQLSKKIQEISHQNQQRRKVHKQLEKRHAKCESLVVSSSQQLQKMKKLQYSINSKQQQLKSLKKSNDQLTQQSNIVKAKLVLCQEKIAEFQSELLQKNIEVERMMGRLGQEQNTSTEKEKILEKCNKLIGSLELTDDQYITNYFQSNGMPLQIQRPLKNKYQMVFE